MPLSSLTNPIDTEVLKKAPDFTPTTPQSSGFVQVSADTSTGKTVVMRISAYTMVETTGFSETVTSTHIVNDTIPVTKYVPPYFAVNYLLKVRDGGINYNQV